MNTSYVKPTFDTTWPNPYELDDLMHKIIYGNITRSETLFVASVLSAYAHLFKLSIKKRNFYMREIKTVSNTPDKGYGRKG